MGELLRETDRQHIDCCREARARISDYAPEYRTKNGSYFLHMTPTGPVTHYASHQGDSLGYGEQVTTLSESDALRWFENHDGADAIEQYSANQIEDALYARI